MTWSGAHAVWQACLGAGAGLVLCAFPAFAAGIMDPSSAAVPKPPYTIKCFQDRDLVIAEDLAAKPVWHDGQWRGRSWGGDPAHPGPEILVQPGGNATCMVKQNDTK